MHSQKKLWNLPLQVEITKPPPPVACNPTIGLPHTCCFPHNFPQHDSIPWFHNKGILKLPNQPWVGTLDQFLQWIKGVVILHPYASKNGLYFGALLLIFTISFHEITSIKVFIMASLRSSSLPSLKRCPWYSFSSKSLRWTTSTPLSTLPSLSSPKSTHTCWARILCTILSPSNWTTKFYWLQCSHNG